MANRKPDISDCYCERTKKTKKAVSGFNCQCYIKGKPVHLKRIDLYAR